ncbi:uncharacterized protein EDB93DRAFT_1134961 [Suillus bovinus]|uniref:uncharacterized protein n=1 Tax=Suillus bovinus TaxID=48563 RepID=UPI001B86C206|nr:uncharacterized protein EDB93DRAFT_1134961 [Suillus bovinus]KAG2153447.1 hypothetical protein EDB93DRAFT_1134961 [Suillus bovinus]
MFLLSLTILSLLHIPFVYSSLLNLNDASVTSTLDVSDPLSCSNTRSSWDIIWSCSATLFACTWTAIHPNIPGMDEGRLTVFSRRLGIMMMALVAPELMITWATLQFLSARDTAKAFNDSAQFHQIRSDYNESTVTVMSTWSGTNNPHPSTRHVATDAFKEWTVTHGFFAWMGGFMLYCNDKPQTTLTPKELRQFVDKDYVEMSSIAEADIEDRSKGDALSKSIAILQLVWFVLQLVARYVQNLPVTLLELDTLAVAALTSIAYGFWWKKPKDVGRTHAVHWKDTAQSLALAHDKVDMSSSEWGDLLLTCIYPWSNLMGSGSYNSSRAGHSRRVPPVGGYEHDNDRHNQIILFVGCFSGAVFGGLHCLGWNALFQGHAEQALWRVASLAILFSPVFILLLFSCNIWLGLNELIAFFALYLSFLVYGVARITLIILISISFRSLPPGVYDTVAWTKFIPHL